VSARARRLPSPTPIDFVTERKPAMASTKKLFKLIPDAQNTEVEHLDPESGWVYADPEGLHKLRQIDEQEYLMTSTGVLGDQRTRPLMQDGRLIHVSELVAAATAYYYGKTAQLMGRPVTSKVRDRYGKIVPMTFRPGVTALDLGVTDVHQPSTLPTYVGGYRISDGIADMMSPVVPVPHQSDYYPTWNVSADFSRKMANVSAAGGQVAEINPGLAFTQYSTVEYALAGAMPVEVQANADPPIRPFAKTMQIIVDALRLEREIRVAALMETSGSYQTSLVQTLLAGAQWNEGAASNPMLVLHKAIDASYLPVTGIGMSGQLFRSFIRNPNVQKFFSAKTRVQGIPTPAEVATELKLPTFYVAEMKYTLGGSLSFVWGNDAVLIHEPAEMPPTSQQDVATSTTFRWTGGSTPPDALTGNGGLTGGMLVRSYFDPRRGPRGSNVVMVAHNDVEVSTSTYVGGLLINAQQ